jgi:hypothetical protein
MLIANSAQGAGVAEVAAYSEGAVPGTFARTLNLLGTGLARAKGVTLVGPFPETTSRFGTISYSSKSSVIVLLPEAVNQGEFQVALQDRRGNQVWGGAIRLGLGISPITSVPAAAISGPINATTVGGRSAGEFVLRTGGSIVGSLIFQDSLGKVRARVGVDGGDEPEVKLIDASGTVRAGLVIESESPRLALLDAAGNLGVLAGYKDGSPIVVAQDTLADTYISMGIYPAGGLLFSRTFNGSEYAFP